MSSAMTMEKKSRNDKIDSPFVVGFATPFPEDDRKYCSYLILTFALLHSELNSIHSMMRHRRSVDAILLTYASPIPGYKPPHGWASQYFRLSTCEWVSFCISCVPVDVCHAKSSTSRARTMCVCSLECKWHKRHWKRTEKAEWNIGLHSQTKTKKNILKNYIIFFCFVRINRK